MTAKQRAKVYRRAAMLCDKYKFIGPGLAIYNSAQDLMPLIDYYFPEFELLISNLYYGYFLDKMDRESGILALLFCEQMALDAAKKEEGK